MDSTNGVFDDVLNVDNLNHADLKATTNVILSSTMVPNVHTSNYNSSFVDYGSERLHLLKLVQNMFHNFSRLSGISITAPIFVLNFVKACKYALSNPDNARLPVSSNDAQLYFRFVSLQNVFDAKHAHDAAEGKFVNIYRSSLSLLDGPDDCVKDKMVQYYHAFQAKFTKHIIATAIADCFANFEKRTIRILNLGAGRSDELQNFVKLFSRETYHISLLNVDNYGSNVPSTVSTANSTISYFSQDINAFMNFESKSWDIVFFLHSIYYSNFSLKAIGNKFSATVVSVHHHILKTEKN